MKRQDTKACIVCKRPMTWRRKWAKTWNQVKYCSAACRRNKPPNFGSPAHSPSPARNNPKA